MAISTKVITEALERAHAKLTSDLQRIETILHQPPSPESHSELSYELAKVRRYLLEHFRYEEQNGYMDVVRKRDPRFDHAIAQLRVQHRELAQTLDGLILQSQSRQTVDEAFRAMIQEWSNRLRAHETKEDELVQEAFTVDVGTKD
jgi:hemerythrin